MEILNELKLQPCFSFEGRTGTEHQPEFTVSASVGRYLPKLKNVKFYGVGQRKKAARIKAADALVAYIRESQEILPSLPEFLKMCRATDEKFSSSSSAETSRNSENITDEEKTKVKKMTLKIDKGDSQSPISMLYKFYRSDINSTTCIPIGKGQFKFTFTIKDKTFDGIGNSRKQSKLAAAKICLSTLMDISFSDLHKIETNSKIQEYFNFSQSFANCIGTKIMAKFQILMIDKPIYQSRKVLAGFLMSENEDPETLKVVSLATGTKCINGGDISMNGAVINDCHAEILARRGLVKYFYDQLELHSLERGNESVFQKKADSKLYQLRKNIKFHLFINTAPCGDARVFSPKEELCIKDIETLPS